MLHAFKISFNPTPKYPFCWKRDDAMSIISDLVSIPVVVHLLHTNWSVLNYIKNFSYKSRFIFVNFLKTDSPGGAGTLTLQKYGGTHYFAFYCKQNSIGWHTFKDTFQADETKNTI